MLPLLLIPVILAAAGGGWFFMQARDQKVAEPRESAREKLDALVKDTASKVSPEKTPKAKSKAKTGPEL